MKLLELNAEIRKMQSKTNGVMSKIANSESDEEVTAQFQGLIKMIRSKHSKISIKE